MALSDKMDRLARINDRAFRADTHLSKVCIRAKVAPSTISRWKANKTEPQDDTLALLEKAMTEIECEREARTR